MLANIDPDINNPNGLTKSMQIVLYISWVLIGTDITV